MDLSLPISTIKECLFIQRVYSVIMEAKRIFAFCANDKLPDFRQLGGHYHDFDGPLLIADLRLMFTNVQVCNGIGYAIKNIKKQIDDMDYVSDPYECHKNMQKTHEKWCRRFSDLMDVMKNEDSDSDSTDVQIGSINGTPSYCDSFNTSTQIPVEEQRAYINSQLASIDTFTFKETMQSEPINVSTEVAIGETLKGLSPEDLAIILAVQEGIDVPTESMERAFENLDRLQNVGAAKSVNTNTATGYQHNETKQFDAYPTTYDKHPKNVDDAGCYIM